MDAGGDNFLASNFESPWGRQYYLNWLIRYKNHTIE